ncbi:hypothetical protein GQR58_002521 [Nymphon striatum]|nr:hypothetical protein GQR58_002521 [Nymphon striatum]
MRGEEDSKIINRIYIRYRKTLVNKGGQFDYILRIPTSDANKVDRKMCFSSQKGISCRKGRGFTQRFGVYGAIRILYMGFAQDRLELMGFVENSKSVVDKTKAGLQLKKMLSDKIPELFERGWRVFTDVPSMIGSNSINIQPTYSFPEDEEEPIPNITRIEVESAIKTLKIGRAAEEDGISSNLSSTAERDIVERDKKKKEKKPLKDVLLTG